LQLAEVRPTHGDRLQVLVLACHAHHPADSQSAALVLEVQPVGTHACWFALQRHCGVAAQFVGSTTAKQVLWMHWALSHAHP
jgi:hypothetical protein